MQYIKEVSDPLSGTTDIKIKVEGKNSLVQKLIDNLAMVIKKRSVKSIRIKSITGYINKETLTHHGKFYDTCLEIVLTNKDRLIGEYKSISNSILVEVNDEIIYDMTSSSFDNDVLADRMISEYIKYLKEKKFSINESSYWDNVLKNNLELTKDMEIESSKDLLVDLDHVIVTILRKKVFNKAEIDLNKFLTSLIKDKNVTFCYFKDDENDDARKSYEKVCMKVIDVRHVRGSVFFYDRERSCYEVDQREKIAIYNFRKNEIEEPKREPRLRWYRHGKLEK